MSSTLATSRLAIAMREVYYGRGKGAALVRALPPSLRRELNLDTPGPQRWRAYQIGTEPQLLSEHLHIDDRRHPDVEHLGSPERLPLRARRAMEIVAFGVLDHMHPFDVPYAVTAWQQGLRHEGRVVVGVKNSAPLLGEHDRPTPQHTWGAQLPARSGGTASSPTSSSSVTSSHQLRGEPLTGTLWDEDFLVHVLRSSGLSVVWLRNNQTGTTSNPHPVPPHLTDAVPGNLADRYLGATPPAVLQAAADLVAVAVPRLHGGRE